MDWFLCRANQWTGFYMITASVMKELNISIIRLWIFLWWLHIFLFFCNKDSKSFKSSPRITRRVLSCTLLIILFDVLEQNIQTRGKWLNWHFTTALERFFSESLSWFDILDKADIFWEAFLHNSLMWLLNVSLLSIITPSIFSSLLFHDSIFKGESFIFCIYLLRHIKWHFPAFRTM